MNYLAFELTMPNINTWNNKWTGADKKYIIVKKVDKEIITKLKDRSWYYDFGDGWGASVSCFVCTGMQKRTLLKNSAGFLSYDWMIDSIIKNDGIYIERTCGTCGDKFLTNGRNISVKVEAKWVNYCDKCRCKGI